ncbi:MAG TPA: GNAT family N-acetyltransferase [Thermodesulfovibrionales bacterium]|nr:GNAT family N-acetyltransferase [Thermodesulfovibrionales bacterium]
MEEKGFPSVRGVLEISGEKINIRLATEADVPFIEKNLRKHNFDTGNLDYNQFVVATENGAIVGFGRITKAGEMYKIGCIVVIEEKRGHGLGSSIVRYLLEYSPVKILYVVTDLVDYFKGLGFVAMREASKELLDALDEACKERGKLHTTLMVYEKAGIQ